MTRISKWMWLILFSLGGLALWSCQSTSNNTSLSVTELADADCTKWFLLVAGCSDASAADQTTCEAIDGATWTSSSESYESLEAENEAECLMRGGVWTGDPSE